MEKITNVTKRITDEGLMADLQPPEAVLFSEQIPEPMAIFVIFLKK